MKDLAKGKFRLVVPTWRLAAVAGLMLLVFGLALARAAWLVTAQREFLQRQGEMRFERTIEVPAPRGRLLDRNGVTLADTAPLKSLWADPLHVNAAKSEHYSALAKALGWTVDELDARLKRGGRRFVHLQRFVPPEEAERVLALKIPGVGAITEYRRQYPHGEAVANVIGLTDLDGKGIEGVERGLDGRLQGKAGRFVVVQDRQGRPVREGEWLEPPQPGQDIVLSIDARLQALAYRAVRHAAEKHHAQAAAAVILDVKTGEVLAMANWPSFDPEKRNALDWSRLRNRALTDAYEPGSVIKPILVSLALEKGVVRPDTRIDVQGGVMTVAGHRISDVHGSPRPLTVREIIQKSSNVGTVKIAQMLPAGEIVAHYHRFGFGQRPELPFGAVTPGRVFPAKAIKPIEVATMAYGHGMSASLLQVANAYQAIANDGCRLPPTFLRVESAPSCARHEGVAVISPATARLVREMLASVTEDGGTGTLARVAGYTTAGKTGTARKLENGVYVHKYLASFIGYAPATQPRIVVGVMVDEPSGKAFYGGSVAAPVFAEIVAEALPMLGVMPDADRPVVAEIGRPRS